MLWCDFGAGLCFSEQGIEGSGVWFCGAVDTVILQQDIRGQGRARSSVMMMIF